jgi:sec-independent protein translocase protein TatB
MLDIGWSEMAVILLVALIVIGPKDLPRVARTIGKWTTKARGMAREFQRSLDDMAREAELQDIKREIDQVGRTDVRRHIEEAIDPDGSLKRQMSEPVRLGESKTPAPEAKPSEPEPTAPTPGEPR